MTNLSDQFSPSSHLEKAGCPHLGLAEDPQTCLTYPSEWNLCHHVKQPRAVNLAYQRKTCLASTHTECPVFQSAGQDRLPNSLRWKRRALDTRKMVLLAVLIVIVLAFVSWEIFYAK
jgi:hypothetical protein